MRKLVVMRGHQGAGKSTFIRDQGLSAHVVSPDQARQFFAGPVLNGQGRFIIDQSQNSRVWRFTHDVLEERMARGELVVVDATHRSRSDFKHYLRFAKDHRYQVACVDFSTQPLEIALRQNQQRPAHAIVPEDILRKTHASCVAGQVPETVEHICWAPDGSHVVAFEAWLREPDLDLSEWPRVHHIGDLQGCFTPLWQYLGEAPPKPDEFYIFIGDLCDRGVENDQVVEHLLAWAELPNVRVIWGNHEDHLHAWAVRGSAKSPEFNQRTLPQLVRAGITREQVDALCDRFVPWVRYIWREQRVLVTHGGFPTVPEHMERISGHQLGRGTGFYSDPVDADFDALAPPGWMQVHGHRNIESLPVQASPRSYNLEGKVEFGGHLRCVVLDEAGFTPIEVPSRVFKPLTQRLEEELVRDTSHLPPWVTPDLPSAEMPEDLLQAFRDHPLVYEKAATSRPYIAAFNFTRDAFFDRQWDALNTRARGLFINTHTREIVARAYDKFFNVGERPETRPESLAANLAFPVAVYRKDNGYLGILGYDAVADDLFFASKSTPDSDFAAWFEEIFDALVPAGKRESLRRFLRDTQSAMAFEVLDPERDPHMIEYSAPRLVLLDVIQRAPAFRSAPFPTLERIGKRFGLETKGFAMRFHDWPSLARWMEKANEPGYLFEGQPVEGFVLEDAAGFMTKLKLDYYNFWKRMRGLKDRVLKVRGTRTPLGRDVSDPRVKQVYEWLVAQPDEVLAQDIISVRTLYEGGHDTSALYTAPVVEPKAVAGFRRAMDALAQLDEIKPAAADGLIARALADDAQLDVLRDAEVRVRLLLAATPGEDRDEAAERLGVDLDSAGELR